jgi:hypothetical protein
MTLRYVRANGWEIIGSEVESPAYAPEALTGRIAGTNVERQGT